MRKFPLIIALFLAFLPVLQAQWDVVTHEGRRFVPVENVATFYKMTQSVSGGDFRLSAQGRSMEGKAGGRDVKINGVKYVLCFPIVSRGGQILISAMDVTKIIEPVMRPQKIQNATAVRTVILDAGHGGHDGGARGPFGLEKDAALDVVLKAKKLLQENGYQVRLTRSTDVFIPLEKRPEFANKHANAIFVSVHFNKSSQGGGTGIETFCLAPRGVPSMDEENLSYSDLKQHPGHARDPENVALATAVHASMVKSLNLPDRGIKRARFVVIKNATVPAILVEGGFMNNPTDSRLIASSSYRQQMAQAILNGVNLFRTAVSGRPAYQKPSVVASASDPTDAPSLRSAENRPVGASTDDRTAVDAVVKSLAN